MMWHPQALTFQELQEGLAAVCEGSDWSHEAMLNHHVRQGGLIRSSEPQVWTGHNEQWSAGAELLLSQAAPTQDLAQEQRAGELEEVGEAAIFATRKCEDAGRVAVCHCGFRRLLFSSFSCIRALSVLFC